MDTVYIEPVTYKNNHNIHTWREQTQIHKKGLWPFLLPMGQIPEEEETD